MRFAAHSVTMAQRNGWSAKRARWSPGCAIARPILPTVRVLRSLEHWELLLSGLRLAAGEDQS
jgi:hypothetical protein